MSDPNETPILKPDFPPQLWSNAVIRRGIIRCMSREELRNCICLSQDTFHEVVRALYAKIDGFDYAKFAVLNGASDRLPFYLQVVREVHDFRDIITTFGSISNFFTTFPNLKKVVNSPHMSVSFSHKDGERRGACIHTFLLIEGDLNAMFKTAKLPLPLPLLPGCEITEYSLKCSEFQYMEELPKNPFKPTPYRPSNPSYIDLPVSDLEIGGPFTLPQLSKVLIDRQQRTGLGPITTLVLQPYQVTSTELNAFLGTHHGQIRSLDIQGFNGALNICTMWDEINWTEARGIRDFQVNCKLEHPIETPNPPHWRTDIIQPKGPVRLPPVSRPRLDKPLHFDSLALMLRIPDGWKKNHPTLVNSMLPSPWDLAKSMVAVGGPMCDYHFEYSNDEEDEDAPNDSGPSSDVWSSEVDRAIAIVKEKYREKIAEEVGWRKVSSMSK